MSDTLYQREDTLDNRITAHPLAVGALFGILGAFLNIVALVPVYGNLTLHLGQSMVILCLLARGFKPAIVAAAIAGGVLSYTIDNIAFLAFMTLEVSVIYALSRRGVNWLVSDLLYWLLIGIPIASTIILTTTQYDGDYITLVMLKQLLNGLLYTLIASVLVLFFPVNWLNTGRLFLIPRLRGQVFYLANLCILLPALLIALVLTNRSATEFERQIQADLTIQARTIGDASYNYIETHQKALHLTADNISRQTNNLSLLDDTQNAFPGFLTMIVTDASGNIVHGAPKSFFEPVSEQLRTGGNVSDRDYFSTPRQTGVPYVSDVFKGRGFGDDRILAISYPLTSPEGQFTGVVEGSLDLSAMGTFTSAQQDVGFPVSIVLTDPGNKVISASDDTRIAPLSDFGPEAMDNPYSTFLPMTTLNGRVYLFQAHQTVAGWHVYVLTPTSVVVMSFISNILILIACLTLVSAIFLWITRRFSAQITEPLSVLIKQFNNSRQPINVNVNPFTPREFKDISGQLSEARNVMLDFNKTLEQEVENKTKALRHLNSQLQRMAREDALTGLGNRRSFDEQASQIIKINARNRQQTTLTIIDIDHFKQINDTYGHPFGDTVIQALADCIRSYFSRTTDITARYGGEEFVILMAAGECESHLKQLEYFRKGVSQLHIQHLSEVVSFSVSIGAVCLCNDYNDEFPTLVQQADEALYESKEQGRNRLTHIRR